METPETPQRKGRKRAAYQRGVAKRVWKNDKWQWRACIGSGPSRRQLFRDTQKEAQDLIDEARMKKGQRPALTGDEQKMTFAKFAEQQLKVWGHRAPGGEWKSAISEKTHYRYARDLADHAIPYLGQLPMTECRRKVLERWAAELRDSIEGNRRTRKHQRATASVRASLIIVGRILNDAVGHGYIDSNPMRDIARLVLGKQVAPENRFTTRKRAVHFFDDDELYALMDGAEKVAERKAKKGALSTITNYDRIFALAETGMRIAEMTGLRLDDFTFDDKGGLSIRIERQVDADRTKTPQSKRWNDFTADSGAVEVFREILRKRHEIEARGATAGYVFFPELPSPARTEEEQRELERLQDLAHKQVRRELRAACREAGLVTATPHDLRHTWISRAESMTGDRSWRERWSGHKSGGMTDVYGRHKRNKPAPVGVLRALSTMRRMDSKRKLRAVK
jgi:integrase